MKINKKKAMISTLLTLVPVAMGFLLWNKLPETMISHYGIDGTADGYSTKLFTITVPFLLITGVHWLCLFITNVDKKNVEQNKKVMDIMYWMIPMISIFVGCLIYSQALGMTIDPRMFVMPLCGVLFIVIGNYLPKCKQNSTVGIKIYWTLKNEENWHATHRFGGKVWVIGGFMILCSMFLPTPASLIVFLVGILVLALLPMFYSYLYYLKQMREDTWVINGVEYEKEAANLARKTSMIMVAPILVFVIMLLFTGNIRCNYEEDGVNIEADYWSDISVKYETIERISYREDLKTGMRTSGFGSIKLSMGTYENEEFGSYTRYCYNSCDSYVVVEVGNKMLVINGEDEAATKEIYETLQESVK